jgi:hypothetical protein
MKQAQGIGHDVRDIEGEAQILDRLGEARRQGSDFLAVSPGLNLFRNLSTKCEMSLETTDWPLLFN